MPGTQVFNKCYDVIPESTEKGIATSEGRGHLFFVQNAGKLSRKGVGHHLSWWNHLIKQKRMIRGLKTLDHDQILMRKWNAPFKKLVQQAEGTPRRTWPWTSAQASIMLRLLISLLLKSWYKVWGGGFLEHSTVCLWHLIVFLKSKWHLSHESLFLSLITVLLYIQSLMVYELNYLNFVYRLKLSLS